MTSKRNAKISDKSQGGKPVQCVRCSGEIEPYAGRAVSLLSGVFAHHPGKCADRAEQTALARSWAQDTLFGWSCAHVEPSYDGRAPQCCRVIGGDRAEFTEHMKSHGAKPLTAPAMIRLHKNPPAAKLAAMVVPNPFKMLAWVEHYGTGAERTEVTRRGQYWSNGEYPHAVWVITHTPAGSGIRPELVQVYLRADGTATRDWSDASVSRREGNRRARQAAERRAA